MVYKWYFSCPLGDYMVPIPPIKGTRNSYWLIMIDLSTNIPFQFPIQPVIHPRKLTCPLKRDDISVGSTSEPTIDFQKKISSFSGELRIFSDPEKSLLLIFWIGNVLFFSIPQVVLGFPHPKKGHTHSLEVWSSSKISRLKSATWIKKHAHNPQSTSSLPATISQAWYIFF